MKLLAIETSSTVCSVALADSDHVLAVIDETAPNRHSEVLAPSVERLLISQGVAINNLDGVAVSIGPGSLTGLRIGLAFAKGLCQAAELPLLAVPTLEATARRVTTSGVPVRVILQARKGFLFTAAYKRVNDGFEEVEPPHVITEEALKAELHRHAVLVGESSLFNDSEFRAFADDMITSPRESERRPSAYGVALIGLEYLARGRTEDIFSVEPSYMMEFEAVKWKHPAASMMTKNIETVVDAKVNSGKPT